MRKGLLTIGILVLVLGAAAFLSGALPGSVVLCFWGAVLIGALLLERFRYKKLSRKTPGPGWQRTAERFVDDETGKLVTVYIDPVSGERAYIEE